MSQTITISAIPDEFMQTIYYSQGDIGRVFVINIREDFTVPSGATVKIKATKPSGFGFEVTGTVTGNSVEFTTTATMTDEAGTFPAELEITNGGVVIGTSNFYMRGEPNPHPDGTIDGQQGTLLPQMTVLVQRIEDAADSIHNLSVEASTLEPNQPATATYDDTTNKISFGIPRGYNITCTDDGDGNVTVVYN